MFDVSRVSLMWRIVLGFGAAALITAASVAVSNISLRNVRSKVDENAQLIGQTFESQQEQTKVLVDLRKTVDAIHGAKTVETLPSIDSGSSYRFGTDEAWKKVGDLRGHKEEQLRLSQNLRDLGKASRGLLESVNKAVMDLVGTTETNADQSAKDGISKVRTSNSEGNAAVSKQLTGLSKLVQASSGHIKSGLLLKYHASRLKSELLEAATVSDNDLLNLHASNSKAILASLQDEFKSLPQTESSKTLAQLLEKIGADTEKYWVEKRKSAQSGTQGSLASLKSGKTVLQGLQELEKLSADIVDTVEFDSGIATDDAITSVVGLGEKNAKASLEGYGRISGLMGTTLSQTKSAFALRNACNRLTIQLNEALMSGSKEVVESSRSEIAGSLKEANTALGSLPQDDATRKIGAMLKELGANTDKTLDAKSAMLEEDRKIAATSSSISVHLRDFEAAVLKLAADANKNVDEATTETGGYVKRRQTQQIALGFGAIAFALMLGWLLARGIVKPVNKIIAILGAGAKQVSSASNQISQSSQQMAEGANTQASNLEEISSSLQEMSSMIQQGASNAREAKLQSESVGDAARIGHDAMARMEDGINRIKNSSDETAKIIKSIDEIAFQTNLLALNAAVEAARAGDAGKGFAVVAEEVRGLAQRSADAAKNTSALIEESQKNAANGVSVTQEAADAFKTIVDGVDKMNHLIEEVSTASTEQAHGVEQVNGAMAQVNQVTQGNAANAEESASASEELSAQSRELQDVVVSLVALVEGNHDNQGRDEAHPVGSTVIPAKSTLSVTKREAEPDAVIPLDHDDLDF